MNPDQPKPTGEPISGEGAGNSDAPRDSSGLSRTAALKPSPEPTGEWEVEGKAVWDGGTAIGCATTIREAHYIADAHNAAIAAEREKLTQLHDEWWERVQDLNKQLAAESEKWDKLADEPLTHAIRKADIEIQQLQSQVQTLVELLQEIKAESAIERTSRNYIVVQITTSTWDKLLAKVKEGEP